MSAAELAALLTALSVLLGAAYTVWNGQRQSNKQEGGALWSEMMNVVKTLRDENARLSADNVRLRDRLTLIEQAIQREIPLLPPKVVDSTTETKPNTQPLTSEEKQE